MTAVSVSSVSTEGTVVHASNRSEIGLSKQNICDGSERIAANVSECPSSAASSPKPSQFSGGGSSLAEAGNTANLTVKEKDFNIAPVSEEEEIDSDVTELTDDSDLYSDDDREDTCSLSVRAL